MMKFQDITRKNLVSSVLYSYSVIFFFNSRMFGLILLVSTFFNFWAGLSGLIAVIFTLAVAGSMGFDENRLKQGIFSFNALLTGIGMGTFFEPGPAFFALLFLAVLFSLILSVTLGSWFGRHGLPFLSIPFVLSFWLILLPSGQLSNLGLTQRNVFWMNEMYSIGGKTLLDFFQTIDNLPLNRMVLVYLRSLSSIIFQDNLLTGILITLALLICSRIAFLLSITGFLTAYAFAHIAGSETAGMSFYNIGANYILVAIAAGGFFVIPSKYSFLWVILLVPLTSLLILFMNKVSAIFGFPFFSLPFSIIVITFVYFLLQRSKQGRLFLTPYQYYSPEVNLYTFRGNIDRNTGAAYVPLHLPFWGEWTVSQGYNGEFTHKGEWSQAIDFILTDDSGRTYSGSPSLCESYLCYNKPVLAPADGIVSELIDNIDDNEPGKVNTSQNWGNTVIIKHNNNLYTQVSHFRPGTFRVRKGDFVRQGDVLGLCGNSGRSPEPHVHFQVQGTPLPGAKPFEYPFSYFFVRSENEPELVSFGIPQEGSKISDVVTSSLLKEAFNLQPGMVLKFLYKLNGMAGEAAWEVFTDEWNHKYLYCKETKSFAYFVNDGTMFYFTSFYGDRKSLLHFFYLAVYRVLLGFYETIIVNDVFPLHIAAQNRASLWLHDLVAPFHQFMKAKYTMKPAWADSPVKPGRISLSSEITMSYFSFSARLASGTLLLENNRISEFSFESDKYSVWAEQISI